MWISGDFKAKQISKQIVIKKVISEINKQLPNKQIVISAYFKNQVPFDSFEEAKKMTTKYYTNCIFDYSYYELPITAEYKRLSKQIENLIKQRDKFSNKRNLETYKSNFITCTKCNSKINLTLYKDKDKNLCPICSNDLRNKNTVNVIEAYNKQIEELEGQLQTEKEKMKQMPKTINRHCFYRVFVPDKF